MQDPTFIISGFEVKAVRILCWTLYGSSKQSVRSTGMANSVSANGSGRAWDWECVDLRCDPKNPSFGGCAREAGIAKMREWVNSASAEASS
jgi:hypothetical protein